MKKQRRKFTSDFKLKVILDALKERHTMTELCQRYELHPNQISNWKQIFLDNAGEFMAGTSKRKKGDDSEFEAEKLFSKIGQLQMEIDFLKKRLS